ncbi:MAG: shikimate dehydrogenase [Campylobacter sp.]|nr:shikimate dehydrogenase [Campylobacter sp.]
MKFAVFGNPIAHSISPLLHNYAIKALNLEAFYGRVLLDKSKNLKDKFLSLGLNGANITVPFKTEAYAISDILSSSAKEIGAVNTLVYKNSKFYGYNTDAMGFWDSFSEFGKVKKALILGAGGTTKAMSYILNKHGVKFDILNRSQKDVGEFKCERFFTHADLTKFDISKFNPSEYDAIINSTSAGLKDESLPASKEILDEIFSFSKYAFDAIYGKATPFLTLAKEHNLQIKDGKDMLVNQAVLALNIFYDLKLDENKIKLAMQKAVNL